MFSETTKKQLIQKVTSKIQNIQAFYPVSNYESSPIQREIVSMISNNANQIARNVAIEVAVQTAIAILEELYTHEDFEKDLGIK